MWSSCHFTCWICSTCKIHCIYWRLSCLVTSTHLIVEHAERIHEDLEVYVLLSLFDRLFIPATGNNTWRNFLDSGYLCLSLRVPLRQSNIMEASFGLKIEPGCGGDSSNYCSHS